MNETVPAANETAVAQGPQPEPGTTASPAVIGIVSVLSLVLLSLLAYLIHRTCRENRSGRRVPPWEKRAYDVERTGPPIHPPRPIRTSAPGVPPIRVGTASWTRASHASDRPRSFASVYSVGEDEAEGRLAVSLIPSPFLARQSSITRMKRARVVDAARLSDIYEAYGEADDGYDEHGTFCPPAGQLGSPDVSSPTPTPSEAEVYDSYMEDSDGGSSSSDSGTSAGRWKELLGQQYTKPRARAQQQQSLEGRRRKKRDSICGWAPTEQAIEE
ncbi:MAG: hypothetical protein SGCHY_004800 [Lobulomycetales sp.]